MAYLFRVACGECITAVIADPTYSPALVTISHVEKRNPGQRFPILRSWQRHKENQSALIAGLQAPGLELFVPNPSGRLPTVTSVNIPQGADDVRVRRQSLDEFGIEIAGGIGPLKGKIWRVGLMGYISQAKHVLFFLAALEKVLCDHGFRVPTGAGVGAAIRLYSGAEVAAVAPRV